MGTQASQKNRKLTLSKNRNSNIPHGTLNNLNISHLRRNQALKYYQTHNNRKTNQYGNRKIDNTPAWNKKKEGELK